MISHSSSPLLKHWRWTYHLDACPITPVSGSNLLKHQRDSQTGCMFSHFGQWFWCVQTLKRDSQARSMFSYGQWFWSAQTSKRNSLSGCMISHSAQIYSILEMDLHPGYMFSYSSQWFWHWRGTHILNACSAILVSGSDLSNTGEGLTPWMHDQPFWSVALICSNIGDRLTSWMHVQPFLLVFWSAQKNEWDSQPRCMFSHSGQWFWSSQTLERDSLAEYSAILVSGSDLIKHCMGLTFWMYSAILVSGSNLLKHKWLTS